MRVLLLMPVAYVAGIEGFGWFVPYVLFICAMGLLVRIARRRARAAALVAQSSRLVITPDNSVELTSTIPAV